MAIQSTVRAVLAGAVILALSPAYAADMRVQPTQVDRMGAGTWSKTHSSIGTNPHYPVSMLLLSEHPEIGMGRPIYVTGTVEFGMEVTSITDRRCVREKYCGLALEFGDTAVSARLEDAVIKAGRRGKALDVTIMCRVIYKRRDGKWTLSRLDLIDLISSKPGPHTW
ncbi:MAG TPA: hypothetical protein VGL66_17855 [Caulobacteraceae bacterium]|jgi:hypothetical protein